MTWLDVGNGWRNLYLLSCFAQAVAWGALFAARGWFCKRSRVACFLTGAAVTPLAQYLWTLLLALVWPGASKWVYVGALPAAACLCLLILFLRRLKRLKALLARAGAFCRRVCRFDKPALVALCFALCLVILLLPPCVRFCSSMSVASGGDAGEYMALGLRYCEDRDLGKLLEKNDTTGHFRGHSHFPSMELYMSHALFYADGDSYGYPYDKPAFTGVGLLAFYMAAAYLALLLVLCRERKRWVLLGALLLNLVPGLADSVSGAPRDIWRILALLWAMLFFAGLDPFGGWKRYVPKLLAVFAVCFTVMSTHVVCFVVLPFVVAAWVAWRWLESLIKGDHRAGRALSRSVGLALAGAAGTVTAFLGNLWCYRQWGEMSPWRLMTTYTGAPWYDMYMQIEYKLEATTRRLNFLTASDSILMAYATPVGVWGLRLALVTLVCCLMWLAARRTRMRKARRELAARGAADGPTAVWVTGSPSAYLPLCSAALLAALYALCTLAPMTGLLDSPLYSFSGAFLKLQRYTLQWFMTAAAMICCALAALEDLWPRLLALLRRRTGGLRAWLAARRGGEAALAIARRTPAYLCALLCVAAFVQGTAQTGYSRSFYRTTRGVMEDESRLMDNGFREEYALLRQVADAVGDEQKILITRVGYQYALRGRGYVLTSNPIVPIMNLPLSEIGGALAEMNVAVIATEPDFWDERYYALSALDEYLRALPPEQVAQTERMRLYLIDPALVTALLAN